MDFLDYLNKTQEFIAVLIVAVPTIGTVIFSVIGKLGKARPIIKACLEALKDRELTDEEMATVAWMLISIISGLWPNNSLGVLKLAPGHQIKNLVANGFITQTQADTLPAKGD
jgi:hypothetical protein